MFEHIKGVEYGLNIPISLLFKIIKHSCDIAHKLIKLTHELCLHLIDHFHKFALDILEIRFDFHYFVLNVEVVDFL